MPSSADPNLGLHAGWDLGESGWNTQMNTNLRSLGALVLLTVNSAGDTTAPASPTNGDRYILGNVTASTGDWRSANAHTVAVRIGGAWVFYTPQVGWYAIARDNFQIYYYSTTSGNTRWVPLAGRYTEYASDTAAGTGGVPSGGLYINSTSKALTVKS